MLPANSTLALHDVIGSWLPFGCCQLLETLRKCVQLCIRRRKIRTSFRTFVHLAVNELIGQLLEEITRAHVTILAPTCLKQKLGIGKHHGEDAKVHTH